MGFLAGTSVKARGSELREFMEHCLGGGFIRDGGADVILFKEVAKTGEVARARERREGIGRLAAEKSFRSGRDTHGLTGVSVNDTSAEFFNEGGLVVEESEGTVVVWVSGGQGGGDGGSHGSRDGWGRSCRGRVGRGVRRVLRVSAGKTARGDRSSRRGVATECLG